MNQVAEFAHGTRGWSDVSGGNIQPLRHERSSCGSRSRRAAIGPATTANPFQRRARRSVRRHPHAASPTTKPRTARQATLTAILGRMATYSGKLVTWDEALASQLQMTTDADRWDAPAPTQPKPDGSYPIAVPGSTRAV